MNPKRKNTRVPETVNDFRGWYSARQSKGTVAEVSQRNDVNQKILPDKFAFVSVESVLPDGFATIRISEHLGNGLAVIRVIEPAGVTA